MSGRTVILGAGESGTGAALLAKKLGVDVFVSDTGSITGKFRSELEEKGIPFEEGGHSRSIVLEAKEIIKSPGIPDDIELLITARDQGIPVISEIEFAGRHSNGFRICVTGSNGKTTTCNLIYHILKKAGKDTVLCGNVGQSFARMACTYNPDFWVLEISSFQLDGMFDFHTDIAILLNITADHLDRYEGSLDRYAASKYSITRGLGKGSAFIYNMDDPVLTSKMFRNPLSIPTYGFSLEEKLSATARVEGNRKPWTKNELIIEKKPAPIVMTLENLALQGRHNVYNSMAAGITAKLLDIRNEVIKECLSDFENIEHRLEVVSNVHGIEFINDSKATNVNATWFALESINRPVVWIAGGVDKGNDYTMLSDLVREKVKAIVCLGKDNSRIKKFFGDLVEEIVETTSAEQAVVEAYYLGKKGDTVLLSPACASFDLFDNFEDRGNQFKNAVKKL